LRSIKQAGSLKSVGTPEHPCDKDKKMEDNMPIRNQVPSAINLEKRIRRHVTGKRLHFFATSTPGFESVTRDELDRLSPTLQVIEVVRGGVLFSGRLTDLYRASLYLSSIGRILLRLADFKATNFSQLRRRLKALPWHLYLPEGLVPKCKVRAHRSRLFHTQAISEEISAAISGYWRVLGAISWETDEQTLYIRLDQDRVTLSADSSGANLYRRGLKSHTARAPLRETAAAAILRLAGYRPDRLLCDPMCGAGTFSLEAALWAKNLAPGSRRKFAFQQWPAFQPRHWEYLAKKAEAEIKRMDRPLIRASDIDASAVTTLRDCVARNDLGDAIVVEHEDFFNSAEGGGPPGLVVLNPPYGRRLQPGVSLRMFYKRIAAQLRATFKGWQVAIIVPDPALNELFPFCPQAIAFEHGGLRLFLLKGSIDGHHHHP
jgi:putative N6-adenine-specific DNA methylase